MYGIAGNEVRNDEDMIVKGKVSGGGESQEKRKFGYVEDEHA